MVTASNSRDKSRAESSSSLEIVVVWSGATRVLEQSRQTDFDELSQPLNIPLQCMLVERRHRTHVTSTSKHHLSQHVVKESPKA